MGDCCCGWIIIVMFFGDCLGLLFEVDDVNNDFYLLINCCCSNPCCIFHAFGVNFHWFSLSLINGHIVNNEQSDVPDTGS